MEINNQAKELNDKITANNSNIVEMLSERGKAIFFPKLGILGQTAEAKGKKINATIGIAVEDDGSPMRLNSIAKNISIGPKDAFPYAPSFGKKELRAKWKEMLYDKNPTLKDKTISLPVVTNALTHGLSIAAYLFLEEGENIIIPNPFWGNYKLVFINGYKTKIKNFECFKEGAFNTEGLKEVLTSGSPGKRVLLLNFPNNPSGYTPTDDDMKSIIATIKEAAEAGNNIVVLVDDAYFGLVYKDGIYKESIFAELADLHEKVLAVKLDGATKEDYVWGFRTGFMTFASKGINAEAADALESKAAGAIRGNISNAPHISQSLVLESFSSPEYKDEKQEKYNTLKGRFDEVEKTISSHEEYKEVFEPLPFNSGYFMCLKLKEGLDAETIRKKLLEKYDTGIIAMGNIIRVAFSAVSKDLIPEMFDNIYKACKEE